MKQFSYIVKDPQGIHARPAGKISAIAKEYRSYVTLWTKNGNADIKKLLQFMGSGVKQGDQVFVRVEGIDEQICMNAIQSAFEENL